MPWNPFGKSIQDIRFDDIQSLKDRKIAENEVLEYKKEIPGRLDLQKEVLGFANNIGGYLVIGVEVTKPENTPERVDGVPKENNIMERIVSTIRDNSSPSFVPFPHLIEMPSDSTRCIIVVYSPESNTVHRASDGRYYYRTSNETIPIRPEFVAKIIDKEKIRKDLERIIENLDWRKKPEFIDVNIGHDSWFGIICCPIPPRSFTIPLFSEVEWYRKIATDALRGYSFNWRSFKNSFRIFVPRDGAPRAMVEFYEDGAILLGYVLSHGKNKPVISQKSVATFLDDFLKLIVEVYHKALFDGGLLIIVSFSNIKGWFWRVHNRWTPKSYVDNFMSATLPSDEPYLEIRQETTVSAIESNVEAIKEAILTKIRRHFNIY